MNLSLLINKKLDLEGHQFYNPGAEINKSFFHKRSLDLGVIRCITPNPIKSLREHLYILDCKHFWKWC
jgi:hypothetical protein